ncbi:GntR family transcriptional regulator [Saccharopolyspora aridisoli]|uniref:GntR family transcriptional regulator n=1 Tax=Saccharopolyspora aridisoli TaxID=2530385 RepID=A0A4R4V2N0_9PSEU|nr:GntR family transcriptional regulator [Saccharopolyspora aridisoli]
MRGAPPKRPPRPQNDSLAQGLRPGDRLPTEAQLVERHGFSRTVIRGRHPPRPRIDGVQTGRFGDRPALLADARG